MSQNVGPSQSIPANGRIELGFDRLLLPASITRQTFVLENAGAITAYTPTIAYDPVARIVTITPLGTPGQALVAGQSYDVLITTPGTAATPNDGLRTIDGATLKGGPVKIVFSVTAAAAPPPTVQIDYCRDIEPIFGQSCGTLPMCHLGSEPASGLLLEPPSGVAQTAVGRVAIGSNTGPQSLPSPPTLLFAEDMPIIDANGRSTGDPGNSWLMYKVLLANPSPEPVEAGAEEEAGAEDAGAPDATLEAGEIDAGTPDSGAADAGGTDAGTTGTSAEGGVADGGEADAGVVTPPKVPPVDVSGAHAPFVLQGISAAERATLTHYILGREMPFPPPVGTAALSPPLTLTNLERLSLWISQGAVSPATCPSQ